MTPLLLLLTPTMILVVSIVAYFFLRNEISRYLAWLDELASINSHILNINFLKEVVKFFGNSPTSAFTMSLMQAIQSGVSISDSEAELLSVNAMRDVEGLHSFLDEMKKNSRNTFEASIILRLAVNIIMIFCVSVSLVQYALIFIYLRLGVYSYIAMVGNIVDGASLIFCIIIGLLLAMMLFRVREIKAKNEGLVKSFDMLSPSTWKQ
ncbi:MAG: hypothetical protein QXV22_03870 [Thermoplasmataceae archaeon]